MCYVNLKNVIVLLTKYVIFILAYITSSYFCEGIGMHEQTMQYMSLKGKVYCLVSSNFIAFGIWLN